MVAFAARTLDKPQERQSPLHILLRVALILYVAWIAYKTFRDLEQSWLALVLAVAIFLGILKQAADFWRSAQPTPWATIEVRAESVTLFGRDGSFHQLSLPQSYRLLPGDRVLVLRWDRSAPRRCRSVIFRKKRDLTEADFDSLYRALQEVAPQRKLLEPLALDEKRIP